MRGLFVGVLALAGLEAVLSSKGATARAGGLITFFGALVDRVLDPTVPAIPALFDDSKSSSDNSSSSSTGGATYHNASAAATPKHPTVTYV